jgi:DNA-binding MarR family transcriptional regulator
MKHTHAILAIQKAYPQVWFACHIEHRTRRESDDGLTDRDSGVLAHIAEGEVSASTLAQHLGIGKSALSTHVRRLEALGLITSRVAPDDARIRLIALTPAGENALARASALNAERLDRLLDLITPAQRAAAVKGLQLLAGAARMLQLQPSGER